MGLSVELTLYHASWCGHCVTFKPEWKKVKKNIVWSELQSLDSFDKKISKSKSRLLFTIFLVPSNSFHIKCIGEFLGKELENESTSQSTNLIKVKIF